MVMADGRWQRGLDLGVVWIWISTVTTRSQMEAVVDVDDVGGQGGEEVAANFFCGGEEHEFYL